MLKQALFSVAILILTLAGPVAAQRVELTSMPQSADRPVGSVDNLDHVLRSAADWISNVFGLAEMQTPPAIRRIPSGRSAFLSGASITSERLPDTAAMNYQRSAHEMVAHYDGTTKTIYLPAGWNGSTPAEMSVLVHAMAHHLQNVGGRKYFDCAEERKALPYEAQERWLGLYGRSLREDFGIDQGVLILITQCSP